MTEKARSRGRVTNSIVMFTLFGWVVLLVDQGSGDGQLVASICSAARDGSALLSLASRLALDSIWSLALGWLAMLAAMMLPTLAAPIFHVYERSFKHRRFRAICLFVIGYSLVWLPVGLLMLAAQHPLKALFPGSYGPMVAVGCLAFIWQCSPLKQRCLNRNHNHAELGAFGIAADLSVFRFGATHGFWCVGSCWALMLFPLLVGDGHLPAMIGVSIIMIAERLDPPRPLSWRVRGLGALTRIAIHAIGTKQPPFGVRFR